MYNIFQSEQPTFIKVFSESCGPCKMMAPIIEELKGEYPDVTFADVNGAENRELLRQYNISRVPTFLFVKGGAIVKSITGATSKGNLSKIIQESL